MRIERIGARYSVRQSSSVAGSRSGRSSRQRAQPRQLTPAWRKAATTGGSRRSADSASTSSVSRALHTSTRSHFEFTVSATAMASGASAARYRWQMPS